LDLPLKIPTSDNSLFEVKKSHYLHLLLSKKIFELGCLNTKGMSSLLLLNKLNKIPDVEVDDVKYEFERRNLIFEDISQDINVDFTTNYREIQKIFEEFGLSFLNCDSSSSSSSAPSFSSLDSLSDISLPTAPVLISNIIRFGPQICFTKLNEEEIKYIHSKEKDILNRKLENDTNEKSKKEVTRKVIKELFDQITEYVRKELNENRFNIENTINNITSQSIETSKKLSLLNEVLYGLNKTYFNVINNAERGKYVELRNLFNNNNNSINEIEIENDDSNEKKYFSFFKDIEESIRVHIHCICEDELKIKERKKNILSSVF
jgi:hypothetical protein